VLAKLRPRSVYDVLAAIGCFVALGGTSAYAINEWTGANIVDESLTGADVKGKAGRSTTAAVNGSLTTHDVAGQQANAANGTSFVDGTLTQWDVKNGSLVGGDLANNTVAGDKVTDNSLKGIDIDEGTLGQVPSAQLGGIGRFVSRHDSTCDPDSLTFATCAVVEIDLPAPARVLLVGAIRGVPQFRGGHGFGVCVLSTPAGPIDGTHMRVFVNELDEEWVAETVVTPFTLGPGVAQFGLACNENPLPEESRFIKYEDARLSAVALSPN
jgi:hypothetical protein